MIKKKLFYNKKFKKMIKLIIKKLNNKFKIKKKF